MTNIHKMNFSQKKNHKKNIEESDAQILVFKRGINFFSEKKKKKKPYIISSYC